MGVTEDQDGLLGVFLKRTVIAVAGRAIAKNLRAMGPKVLPWTEQVPASHRLPLRCIFLLV